MHICTLKEPEKYTATSLGDKNQDDPDTPSEKPEEKPTKVLECCPGLRCLDVANSALYEDPKEGQGVCVPR